MKQLQYEADAWLRNLEFIRQENVYLKNRLAGIIESQTDKHFLEMAEEFQNNFINKDAITILLKNDIHAHERELLDDSNKFDSVSEVLLDNHKRLREDMEKLAKEFSRLKLEFNNNIDVFAK